MNTKDTELLDVSLIIATYNEEESLGYVLNEIKDFNIGEIIIIDKNSTDNTNNIDEKYIRMARFWRKMHENGAIFTKNTSVLLDFDEK